MYIGREENRYLHTVYHKTLAHTHIKETTTSNKMVILRATIEVSQNLNS